MKHSVDEPHAFDTGFISAMKRLDELDAAQDNKDLVKRFIKTWSSGYLQISQHILSLH